MNTIRNVIYRDWKYVPSETTPMHEAIKVSGCIVDNIFFDKKPYMCGKCLADQEGQV